MEEDDGGDSVDGVGVRLVTLLTPEARHDRCVVAIATGSSCEFTLACHAIATMAGRSCRDIGVYEMRRKDANGLE